MVDGFQLLKGDIMDTWGMGATSDLMTKPGDMHKGDRVVKKSGKPFKKSEDLPEALKYDIIESFSINQQDPQKRVSALLKISKTEVNVCQLMKVDL